jgi:hypothetical protein
MDGRNEISAITLRRGPCFGFCPVYEVTIQADGRATWRGERFVERLGAYEGEIGLEDFRRVAGVVERSGFLSWDDEYTSGTVDTPDYHLTVERDGSTKTVRQNATDTPPDFWVIAALVDALAAGVEWTPAPDPSATREGADDMLTEYKALPSPESCRLIDFEQTTLITLRVFPPRYLLTVRGTKPWANMDVDLVPRQYIRRPEYHGIEVVGCLRGFGPPVLTPYSVTLDLDGLVGTRGIEVVGANRSEIIDVPEPSACSDWVAFHDHQPPGPATLRVTGTCRFGRAGYVVALRRAEPQGVNPADLILELTIDEPELGADVLTEVEARYEEVTDLEYDTVSIRPGPTIPVQDVS